MPGRTTAAKRYAEAIAALARQDGSWQRWRQDLSALGVALKDRLLQHTLESPSIPFEAKSALLDRTLGQRVAPQTANLLKVMGRRGRLSLLPDMVTWFDDIADRELGVRRYTVTSAAPLTDDQRDRFRQRLGASAGLPAGTGQVILTEYVDPSLMGGLVVQQGDIIRDYSVRTRLESLRHRLN